MPAPWEPITAVIGSAATVIGLVAGAVKVTRDEAKERQRALDRRYADGIAEGKRQMQPTIELLTSQLGDARHDRDVAQAEANEGWRRYNDLLEEVRRR